MVYLAKLIPNLSELTASLRKLLEKNVLFEWSHEQQTSFKQIKSIITKLPTLKYFDVNRENVLSVDCSSYAMGAVLLQNGRPVAYASKALSPTQKRYPQIEKEGLAIRFRSQKFHSYL